MNLPGHVKRGEVLQQDIYVFNYLNKTQNVTLSILRNDQEFEVLDPSFDGWNGNEFICKLFEAVYI